MTTPKALTHLEQRQRAEHEASEQRIQEALKPLIEAVTNPDEASRRAAVEHIQMTCQPIVLVRLVHRLVSLLGEGPSQRREQIIASLVQFGPISVSALTGHFRRNSTLAFQRDVAEALDRVGRSLFIPERVALMEELVLLMPTAADDSVRGRLAGLLGVLRRANGSRKRWES